MAKKSTENEQKPQKKRQPWNKILITGEQLADMVDQYLDMCNKEGRRATKPGLAVYCGFSVDTYDNWIHNKDKKHSKHQSVLKKAEAIMSDRLQQESNAMAIFLSKQPCYGGLSDKQDSSPADNKLTIEILSNGTKVN